MSVARQQRSSGSSLPRDRLSCLVQPSKTCRSELGATEMKMYGQRKEASRSPMEQPHAMIMPSFRFVLIPAGARDEIEEKQLEIPEGKDVECFLDHVKQHFTSAGGEKTEAMRVAQRQMLMQQLGEAAAKLDPSVLDGAVNMQMVENIALLPNSRETGFVGVNMYCDDQAQVKNLEHNHRASQLALCCGKPLEVRGDAFLARVFDNEDDFKRLDLTLREVSSSAEWVKQAASIAKRKLEDSGDRKDFLDRLNKKQFTAAAGPNPIEKAEVRELTPAEAEKDEGNKAFKKGEWQAAIDRYTVALELDSSMLPALNNRALALLKLERYEEAERDCTTVLGHEPNNVKALLRRAAAFERQPSKVVQALADAETALKIEPNNAEARAIQQRLLPPPPPKAHAIA